MSRVAKRRPRTELVIAALLRGRTLKEAAAEVGMGYRTLKYWLSSDWFRAEYGEAKKLLLDSTINQLRAAGGEGVETLRDVARNRENPPAARATAGRALVEMLLRAVETQDIVERLERVEAAAKESEGDESRA